MSDQDFDEYSCDYSTNTEEEFEEDIKKLYDEIMQIFMELTFLFVEYLHFLESPDKRKIYLNDAEIEVPNIQMHQWIYIFSEECQKDYDKINKTPEDDWPFSIDSLLCMYEWYKESEPIDFFTKYLFEAKCDNYDIFFTEEDDD